MSTEFKLEAPDHWLSYEKNLIGQMMLQPGLVEIASDTVVPTDLQDEKLRHVYLSMLDATADGKKSLGAMDLVPYLQKRGIFDLIGINLLTELDSQSASTIDFDHNLAKVQTNARRKQLVSLCSRYQGEATLSKTSVDELVEGLIADAVDIVSGNSAEIIFADVDAEPENLREAMDASSGESEPVISSGLASLDRRLDGFRDGSLYILASRPGMGKSALGLHFALSAAEQKKTALCSSARACVVCNH